MTINAGKTTVFGTDRARAGGHDPVIQGAPLAGDAAAWPTGLVLSRTAGRTFQPYGEHVVKIGDGDAAEKDFAAVLGKVEPGSVEIGDGTETFTDNGMGSLAGSAGGTGTINYATGKLAVSFNAAPGDGVDVNATCTHAPAGVLDVETDTAASSSGVVIVHGSVSKAALKVGVASPAAAPDTLIQQLEDLGIYPV